jgi:peptidoglycan/xylan/chitin deacetylase (PgdA/CDA1 family)
MDWIKKGIQNAAGFVSRILGIYRLLQKVVWREQVAILVYHDPEPEVFREHILFLSKYHQFISLSRFVTAMYRNDKTAIPPNSLIVTLDDGHQGNYRLLETIKAFQLRPTIYLCSHIVNTHRHFWWKSGYSTPQQLKKLPHHQALTLLYDEVNFTPTKEYPDRQTLSASELFDMFPYVEFGSHTKFHPILPNCSAEESEEEIRESKAYLEKLLNQPIDQFCFPNGDYGARELYYLKKHGYRSARTLVWGRNNLRSDPFQLKVVEVLDNSSINMLCAQLCGFFGAFRKARSGFRRISENTKRRKQIKNAK